MRNLNKDLLKVLGSGCAALVLALLTGGCGLGSGNGGGNNGGGSNNGGGGGVYAVACEALDIDASAGLDKAKFWASADTYGLDAFYVWEVDATTDGHYKYHGTSLVVPDSLPSEGWTPKDTSPLWSAIRWGADGYDPYKFNPDDPFYLWYLPYTPGSSWQSRTGAHNDGTCPDDNYQVNGRPRCQEVNELDPQAPWLTHGKTYLFQMNMLPPPPFCLGDMLICVQSCYRVIKTY